MYVCVYIYIYMYMYIYIYIYVYTYMYHRFKRHCRNNAVLNLEFDETVPGCFSRVSLETEFGER